MKWLIPWALHPVTRGVGSSTGLNFDSFFHGKGPDSSMGSSGTLAGSRDANRDPREKLSKRYLVCAGRALRGCAFPFLAPFARGCKAPSATLLRPQPLCRAPFRGTLPVCCSGTCLRRVGPGAGSAASEAGTSSPRRSSAVLMPRRFSEHGSWSILIPFLTQRGTSAGASRVHGGPTTVMFYLKNFFH